MYRHSRNFLFKYLIIGCIFFLMGCSAYAQEGTLLCPEDKLIMIRAESVGETAGKYLLYDCYGSYLGSMIEGFYYMGSVDLLDDNMISEVYGSDTNDIYLIKEGMKKISVDVEHNGIRQIGNLIICTIGYDGTDAMILNRYGEEVFSLPYNLDPGDDYSTSLSQIIYEEHGEVYDYYIAGAGIWDKEKELYLIDVDGNIIYAFENRDFIDEIFWSGASYKDGRWYVYRLDAVYVYDCFENLTGTISTEEYDELFPKEEIKLSSYYIYDEEETVAEENEYASVVTSRRYDEEKEEWTGYVTLYSADGRILEEAEGYTTRYTLKDDYYICSYRKYLDERMEVYSVMKDYQGNVLKEFPNATVGGWCFDEYLTMDHGKYRGLIDLNGNWVLKEICVSE